jgi:hypothetical protein
MHFSILWIRCNSFLTLTDILLYCKLTILRYSQETRINENVLTREISNKLAEITLAKTRMHFLEEIMYERISSCNISIFCRYSEYSEKVTVVNSNIREHFVSS